MTRRRIVVATAALLTAAIGAPRAARAQDARLAAIADADVRATIGAIIVDAERRGLPREPLVNKALEGVEKGAPAPRIEAAVRAMVARLTTARTLLSPVATAAELRAVVDALAAGVPPAAVRTVSGSAGGRPTPVSVGVLAQLVARGVPSGDAARVVSTLVARGAKESQFLALQRDVQTDLSAGLPPTTALELRSRAVIAALPPPIPAPAATAIPTHPRP